MYLLQHYKLLWMNSHYHQIFVIFIKVAVFWLRNWPVKRPQWLGSNEKRICKTITVGLSNMWTRKKLSVNYPVNTRFWRLTYFRRFCGIGFIFYGIFLTSWWCGLSLPKDHSWHEEQHCYFRMQHTVDILGPKSALKLNFFLKMI